jgi:hypothetical protein
MMETRTAIPEISLDTQDIFSELLGFWTSSIIWYSRKLEETTLQKLVRFHPQVRVETPTLLCSSEKATHHRTTYVKVKVKVKITLYLVVYRQAP